MIATTLKLTAAKQRIHWLTLGLSIVRERFLDSSYKLQCVGRLLLPALSLARGGLLVVPFTQGHSMTLLAIPCIGTPPPDPV